VAHNGNDVLNKGSPFQAESRTEFVKAPDVLRLGFKAGYFFELQDFNYSVGSQMALAKKDEDPDAPVAKPKSDFVDIQPVGFTRIFDMASIALFTALVASQTLDSVTVVKRKAAGSKNAGEIYLRLDFNKVLLTSLDWSEKQDAVTEVGSFIYRELEVQYRPQRPDGTLGAIIPSSWRMAS